MDHRQPPMVLWAIHGSARKPNDKQMRPLVRFKLFGVGMAMPATEPKSIAVNAFQVLTSWTDRTNGRWPHPSVAALLHVLIRSCKGPRVLRWPPVHFGGKHLKATHGKFGSRQVPSAAASYEPELVEKLRLSLTSDQRFSAVDEVRLGPPGLATLACTVSRGSSCQ